MRMNRRNVLVGLGTIVAGGGAALGTGAFSSVEADRTVNVSTAGDASAYLSLDNETSGYVSESNGTVEIDLDGSAGTGDSNGLNINATTEIDPLINVANKGDSPVGLYVSSPDIGSTVKSTTSDGDQVLQVEVTSDGSTTTGDAGTLDLKFYPNGESINSIVDDENTNPPSTSITDGGNKNIGLEIDTAGVDGSVGDIGKYTIEINDITFVADSS